MSVKGGVGKIVEYGGEGAVSFGQTRNAVDYIVRLVVEPSAIINLLVGWVFLVVDGEREVRAVILVDANAVCAFFDAARNFLRRGAAIAPLMGIAVLCHVATSGGVDASEVVKILAGGDANLHVKSCLVLKAGVLALFAPAPPGSWVRGLRWRLPRLC